MNKEEMRFNTYNTLNNELNKILNNYMQVYDEYYFSQTRDSAFLKDLVDGILGISAVLEVYVRDKKIHPSYALEKLRFTRNYVDMTMRFYERKLKELDDNTKNESN